MGVDHSRRASDRRFGSRLVAVAVVASLALTAALAVSVIRQQGRAGCAPSSDATSVAITAHLPLTGTYPRSFDDLLRSGALLLPPDTSTDESGAVLRGSGWRLVLGQPTMGGPPAVMCEFDDTA